MPKPVALNPTAMRGLCCLAVLALSLVRTHAQYDPDWTHSFRAGVIAGFNIKASFKSGTSVSFSGSNPGATNKPGVNHFFDDGYVRVDDFKNAEGYTTFWGYQNASQNDTANHRLLYHDTSSFTTTSGTSTSGNAELADVGFELAFGGYPWRWETMRLGFDIGFGYLPINISGNESFQGNPLSGNVANNTYSFDTGNIVVPGAPYNGGRSGFGQPSIHDLMSLVSSSNTPATLSGVQTLEVTLYSFRLGPSLYWDLSRHFGLSVSAGPAIGIVTGDLLFNETVTVGGVPTQQKGQVNSTEFVYGGYINAMLTYHVVQNGDVYLGVQYMPLSNANFSGGGRSAKLDMKGALYVTAGINWPF